MAKDLVSEVINQIQQAILSGEFTPGEPLPREAELAGWLDVSRPTMREAVRTLAERGVLEVKHGLGTYVVDPDRWTDLASVIWWTSKKHAPSELGNFLVQVRRMLEVGACGLAAENRCDADLVRMEAALDDFDEASRVGDIEQATQADLRFHNLIFESSGNPLLSVIMQPLQDAMAESRRATSSFDQIRQRAATHHRKIFAAIRDGDADQAKNRMRSHMSQTAADIQKFLADATT